MKKAKKYAEGGLAGLAETAESLMGDVDNMANNINYGSGSTTPPTSNAGTVGLAAVSGYKKGGKVSSASKRADGCAVRGKTRA